MAKMFYTLDETKATLGISEEDIRQLVREGKLREFRDGPRPMYKTDQVESLKADAGGEIAIAGGDTAGGMGLMDSKTGSGTAVGISADSPTNAPTKEDTASGLDVGLSGSLSGSIGGGSLAGGTIGGSVSGARGKTGVNVFGDEGSDGEVDPMAQTHITPPKDKISLEGVGSGSGQLDLTRETDDTSLGAALLDEISPGGKRQSPTPGAAPSSGSTAGMASILPVDAPEPMQAGSSPMFGAPMVVEAHDPITPAFSGMSIAGILVLLFAGFILINAIIDSPIHPGRGGAFEFMKGDMALYIFLGVGVVLAIVFFVIGMVAGKGRSVSA